MPEKPSSEQLHRAEEAKRLLSSDLFAEMLTAVRMDAMMALATADADDKTAILTLQATVRVTDGIRDALMAAILRTGEHDGGMTA